MSLWIRIWPLLVEVIWTNGIDKYETSLWIRIWPQLAEVIQTTGVDHCFKHRMSLWIRIWPLADRILCMYHDCGQGIFWWFQTESCLFCRRTTTCPSGVVTGACWRTYSWPAGLHRQTSRSPSPSSPSTSQRSSFCCHVVLPFLFVFVLVEIPNLKQEYCWLSETKPKHMKGSKECYLLRQTSHVVCCPNKL